MLVRVYEFVLIICFYSDEKYQNILINLMFKFITSKNITSEYFRTLAVLVSKFGLEESNIC